MQHNTVSPHTGLTRLSGLTLPLALCLCLLCLTPDQGRALPYPAPSALGGLSSPQPEARGLRGILAEAAERAASLLGPSKAMAQVKPNEREDGFADDGVDSSRPQSDLLSGLLSGTLIGSLLTRQPITGIGVADLLVLLFIIMFVRNFLRRKRGEAPETGRSVQPDIPRGTRRSDKPNEASPSDQTHAADAPMRQGQGAAPHRNTEHGTGENHKAEPLSVDVPEDEPNKHLYEQAARMWGHLQGNDTPPQQAQRETATTSSPHGDKPGDVETPLSARDAYRASGTVAVPAGFDTEDFLKGARMVFARLQQSWDSRNIDDIAQFTTPEVYEEIASQAAQNPTPSQSELLLVNARLMEVREEESELLATVFFDVLMREDTADAQTEQVREIWHFLKSEQYGNMWRLDGIEHVAA